MKKVKAYTDMNTIKPCVDALESLLVFPILKLCRDCNQWLMVEETDTIGTMIMYSNTGSLVVEKYFACPDCGTSRLLWSSE